MIHQSVRRALAAVAAVAAIAGAGTAQAQLSIPNDGGTGSTAGSDLVLVLASQTATPSFYLVDLGSQFDNVLYSSTNYDNDINGSVFHNRADGTLGSFTLGSISDPNAAGVAAFISGHTNVVWSIMANNSDSATALAGGFQAGAFTSATNFFTASGGANDGNAASAQNAMQNFFDAEKTGGTNPSNTLGFGSAGNTGQNAPNSFIGGAFPNGGTVGTAFHVWEAVTTAGSSPSGLANVYESLNTIMLNADGTLTVSGGGGGSVPLPAAVWLLGSGLLGLAGVGRRKVVPVAA
jgi:hypothetical protein